MIILEYWAKIRVNELYDTQICIIFYQDSKRHITSSCFTDRIRYLDLKQPNNKCLRNTTAFIDGLISRFEVYEISIKQKYFDFKAEDAVTQTLIKTEHVM